MANLIDYSRKRKRDVFDCFYDSGLHARNNKGTRTKNWPRETVCIFETDYHQPKIVKNIPWREHAERIMLDYLMELESDVVKVFMNYSPCHRCTEKLINFIKDSEMEMEIYFVQLYHISRRSCKQNYCTCTKLPWWFINANEENERGLQQLSKYALLQNFTETQWEELASLLKVKNTSDKIRYREDEEIASDLDYILS
jgi:APOBEC-like N-terminal domain.